MADYKTPSCTFNHLITRRLLTTIEEVHQQAQQPLSNDQTLILYSAIHAVVKPAIDTLGDQVVARVLEIEKSWK